MEGIDWLIVWSTTHFFERYENNTNDKPDCR